MIHIRIDHEELNVNRRFACGIGPELPPGDKYFFESESMAYRLSDCPGCNPGNHSEFAPMVELAILVDDVAEIENISKNPLTPIGR